MEWFNKYILKIQSLEGIEKEAGATAIYVHFENLILMLNAAVFM